MVVVFVAGLVVVVVVIVVVVVVSVVIFMVLVPFNKNYLPVNPARIRPRLCLNIYIVDVLCNMDKDVEERLLRPTREQTAIAVGVLYVSPMLVLQLWDLLMLSFN